MEKLIDIFKRGYTVKIIPKSNSITTIPSILEIMVDKSGGPLLYKI